jgi:hypothetical protein
MGAAEQSGVHTPPPLTRADLVEVLRREHIMGEPLAALPADLDAEREIVAGVLGGQVTVDDLAPLRGEHFRSALGAALEVLRDRPMESAEQLASALAAEYGRRAWDLVDEVSVAALLTRGQLHQRAALVVELWRRRQLVQVMRSLDASLCVAESTFDEAVGVLRDVILEARS